ncbi:MAG: 23S rRNA (pseudouridine(1915)-N(3))-methyltransferase RlmH [Flavobacteriales bacterium]|nr:23S rRNA (pseudouridine(1915)-N(3))-methyltransferase RlmH [Flavobacteriales bacterium]
MKLITVGKTRQRYISEGLTEYLKKLGHYLKFEYIEIPDVAAGNAQVETEGKKILARISPDDFVVLLDEGGQEYSSVEFSRFLQKKMNAGTKCMVMLIGGPFGFSNDVIARGDMKLSFSKMTFNHEMIRIFVLEQLYRAHTIIKGEPYHHA